MWLKILQFFGAWFGAATPQRADFESVTGMHEKLNDRLVKRVDALEQRLEEREKYWEEKERAMLVKIVRLIAICRECKRANSLCEELRKDDLERLTSAEERIKELEAKAKTQ